MGRVGDGLARWRAAPAAIRRVAGWGSLAALRAHLTDHTAGRLQGDIPRDVLRRHRLNQCQVCSRLLSERSGEVCPICRPHAMREDRMQVEGRPIPTSWPSLEKIFSSKLPTRQCVPRQVQGLWGQVVTATVAGVAQHNDLRSWVELCMLPRAALLAPLRGAGHTRSGWSELRGTD